MADENLNEQTLDKRIDEAASDAAAFDKFRDIDWPTLSDVEFQQKQEQVFRQMRSLAKLRQVAADVRVIDAETEARKRRKAEPKDVRVTFSKSD